MANDNTRNPDKDTPKQGGKAGVQHPDPGGSSQPAQKPVGPASGGDGATGAGGPDGFGTGS